MGCGSRPLVNFFDYRKLSVYQARSGWQEGAKSGWRETFGRALPTQSATKSEKTYLACLVMTETTISTGLIFPDESVATRGNTLPTRAVR